MKPIRVVGRKQKLMDFLHSEEGNADRSKVLATSAVLGGSVLAQMLLATTASANACPGVIDCGNPIDTGHCLERAEAGECGLSCPHGPTLEGTCYDI